MPLFHQRVLERHLQHIQADQHHIAILEKWTKNLERGVYNRETQNDGEFIQRILIEVLGYVGSSEGKNWTVAKNQPVGSGNVDVALGHFTPDSASIIAPMELKGAKTQYLDAIMHGRNKSPVTQAWEYAMDAKGAKWVLVSNFQVIRLYAIGYGRKEYELFDLTKMSEPGQYAKFITLLSAENLLGEKTYTLLKECEQAEKDITDQLYKDYRELRMRLIKKMGDNNPRIDKLVVIRVAQTILDRVLFIAFAEDKGLLPDKTLVQTFESANPFNPQPIWENFKGLFRYINEGNPKLSIPGYNGGLFADDNVLNSLKISDDLCHDLRKIGEYDFDSDISVNILGKIFEQSISDLEELKNQSQDSNISERKITKRKRDGIFYTPPHITRYMVEQAVGGWLADRRKEIGFAELPQIPDTALDPKQSRKSLKAIEKKSLALHIAAWEAYQKAMSNIKVLDPACGSGAFLNEVFDYLYSEGQTINNELARLRGRPSLFRWDKHILANNIYGVDINRESVEITKLSLWLKTANKNEKLTYLEDNVKCGNSLIDDPNIAGELAFDWQSELPEIMESGGFDVVVGNPPYVLCQPSNTDEDVLLFYKNFKVASYKIDLFHLFFERGISRLKPNGKFCYITPNTYLTNTNMENLRAYLLGNKIISLSLSPKGVFRDASVDVCIILMEKTHLDGNNVKIFGMDNVGNVVLQNEIPQAQWENNKSKTFTIQTPFQIDSENTCPLGSIASVTFGLQTKDKSIYVRETSGGSDWESCYTGRDIARYYLKEASLFFKNCPTEVKAGGSWDMGIHHSKKIVVRQIGAPEPLFAFDDFGLATLNTMYSIALSNEKNFSYGYLLAILCSSLIKNWWLSSFSDNKDIFPKIKGIQLKQIPIKKISRVAQQPFVDLADTMRSCNITLHSIRRRFFNRLFANFDGLRITGPMEYLEKIDFNETFLTELIKQGVKLSLSEQDEWEDYFDACKSECQSLVTQIATSDKAIDQLVYALYGLSPNEIAIIEAGN